MNPINFHKNERIFKGQEDENIGDLPVLPVLYNFPSGPRRGLTSCWKPTLKDRILLAFGKPVFVSVIASTQPPIVLTIDGDEVGAD